MRKTDLPALPTPLPTSPPLREVWRTATVEPLGGAH
jgi:hypothetical protein